ncbi:TPA: hypothetical protein ACH3X3_002224 [Trebouxia sp. C0006]
METPTAFQVSRSQFMQWGHRNAQFLGVGLAILGSTLYAGGKFQQLQDQRLLLQKDINSQRAVFEARIEAARAEAKEQKAQAIQQCNEKFLAYGYAAEYKALQQKTLGERAPTTKAD